MRKTESAGKTASTIVVELAGRVFEVVAERLLDDDPPPAVALGASVRPHRSSCSQTVAKKPGGIDR